MLLKVVFSAIAALLSVLTFGSAWAQVPDASEIGGYVPPRDPALMGSGVDAVSGTFTASSPSVTIGDPSQGGLSWSALFSDDQWRHSVMGGIATVSSSRVLVAVGGSVEEFVLSAGSWSPDRPSGSSLAYNATTDTWTYTLGDGTVVLYTDIPTNYEPVYGYDRAQIDTITTPAGLKTEYHFVADYYEVTTTCRRGCSGGGSTVQYGPYTRLQSVTNNMGYQLHFEYAASAMGSNLPAYRAWARLARVRAINNAVEYCAPLSNTCSTTQDWPELNITGSTSDVSYQDNLNRTTVIDRDAYGQLMGIQPPGETSNLITVVYDGSDRVTSQTVGALTTTYSRSDVSGTRTTTITAPGSIVSKIESNVSTGLVTATENALGDRTVYTYNANDQLYRVTMPEGEYTQYTYDGRGNVTQVRQVAQSGSGLADIVTSASYPSSCTNPVTCNRPTSTTDAAGNVTNYTYDSTHGSVLTVTLPAPSAGAARPQTRYTYASFYAYYRQSSGGGVSAAPSAIYLPTKTSSCQSGASCTNSTNEAVAIMGYGASGVANNRQPVTLTQRRGDGSHSVTTTLSYDNFGNLIQSNGPRTAYDDSTYYRYDALRRLVGTISPDPDGASALARAAARNTYDTRGRVVSVEYGTVTGTSDTAWNAFSVLDEQEVDYDTLGRATQTRLVSTGGTHALRQYSYNAAGQLECVAQRMNPMAFSSPPSSACSLGTASSYGPDRITRNTYDAVGRLATVTSAYNTTAAATEASYTYTDNGQVATLTDGEGNEVVYTYDGFSRLVETDFPHPSTAGAQTGSDDTHVSYDAYGRVASHTTRSGQVFAYSYDNLHRITNVNAPSGQADTSYTYDNFHRLLTITSDGRTITNTWTSLGRLTTQNGPNGTVTYGYDSYGRVNRLTWPDSFYVTYDYNQVGAPTAIRENGATSGIGVLAEFEYDSRGRRTALRRGNGADTTYDYDAASRLEELSQDLPGTTNDQTSTFTYNPAGQITSRVTTNDAWAWDDAVNATLNYGINGLNQVTSITGLSAPSYDSRGNMTSDGVRTYGYDYSNRLTSVSGGVGLEYDPLGRLWEVTGSTTRRFQYDGDALIAEYNTSGTLQMRYVHGPGIDEPLVAYTGSGTSTRRWLHADERGSIVAETNHTGGVTQINAYDEYGLPSSGNSGRFGYTGQVYLEETGLYHYKARAYNPTLGRFMQTDPIEHSGGMNLYAYVGGDPINFTDPTGLVEKDENGLCPAGTTESSDGNCYHSVIGVTGSRGGGGGVVLVGSIGSIGAPVITIGGGGRSGGGGDEGRVEESCREQVEAAFNKLGIPLPAAGTNPNGDIWGISTTAGGHLAIGGVASAGVWYHPESGRMGLFDTAGIGGGVSAGVSVEAFHLADTTPEGFEGMGVSLSGNVLFVGGAAQVARGSGSVFDPNDRLAFRGGSGGITAGPNRLRAGLSLDIVQTRIYECE